MLRILGVNGRRKNAIEEEEGPKPKPKSKPKPMMGDGAGSDDGGRIQQQWEPSAWQPMSGGANNDDGGRPSQQREQQQPRLGWEQTMRESLSNFTLTSEVQCRHCSDPYLECVPDHVHNFFTELLDDCHNSFTTKPYHACISLVGNL